MILLVAQPGTLHCVAQPRVFQIQFALYASPGLVRQTVFTIRQVHCLSFHGQQFQVDGVFG